MSRYPEVEVTGSPREMGRQIGEAARDQVRGFCEIALQRVRKTTAVTDATARRVAQESGRLASEFRPDMMDELVGVAEAAGVSIDDLMLLQVRNQLQAEKEAGCTAIAARSPSGETVVAQNWDNDPELDPFTIVLTRRPSDKPALLTCTQAGLISYIGFNASAVGACVNTLPAPSREVGVPHYFILRAILEAGSLDETVRAADANPRAIPANIMLATPQGPADLEVTLDAVRVLRPEAHDWLVHTNHCLHQDLHCHNQVFPELIQSYPRLHRAEAALSNADGAVEVEALKLVLGDHTDYPRSICRHRNDDPTYGFWETVFSIIMEPSKGRMHVSRGTPCSHAYETYLLSVG